MPVTVKPKKFHQSHSVSPSLAQKTNSASPNKLRLNNLLRVSEEINHIKDIDALLDKVLYESRRFTNADAGSIYLVDEYNDKILKFSYVQNDTLFRSDENNKYLYSNQTLPIDDKSIAGYVALTGKSLTIRDAYKLPSGVSYSFNSYFDQIASYRTKSIFAFPLKTSRDKVVGVIQIINALDKKKKMTVSFSEQDKLYVMLYANNAAVAIERAIMTRAIILRMIKMAELRDPKETGPHVNRVAAYSIEIYQRWARLHQIPEIEIKRNRDLLRIAAMLHDVGKVAISDTILKKPGKLDPDEYETMKTHTVMGCRLFKETTSDWDALSADIALSHHEKWDGTGYPGKIENIYSDVIQFGSGKKSVEIPLFGRIVGLADVYDALISKRVYKEAWNEEDVKKLIQEQSGRQFDPEVVKAFFEIYDVIQAIRDKYKD